MRQLQSSKQRGPAGLLPGLFTGLCRAALPALMMLGLTGCYSIRTRTVGRTVVVTKVLDATLDQLLTQLAKQDDSIQTMNAKVDITASTGGEHEGEVKELPTFSGYIFLRRPGDLRVLMLVPLARSTGLDMVSDGTHFKLNVPYKQLAVIGEDKFTDSSKNGLENLRPYIVRDALLIPTATPDQYVTLTRGSRITPPGPGQKDSVEEPDYDITILSQTKDHVLEQLRVIHFGRITLQPYQQDYYHDGRIVTTVAYDKYQKFGELTFPQSIVITQPTNELKLKIDITKLTLNQKLDDEQFVLQFPEGGKVKTM